MFYWNMLSEEYITQASPKRGDLTNSKKPPSSTILDGGFCFCCLITISYHHLGRRAVLAFCHTGLGILGALGALAVGSGVGICPL